jgi:hypothetical protein
MTCMPWRPVLKQAAVSADIIWRPHLTHRGHRRITRSPISKFCNLLCFHRYARFTAHRIGTVGEFHEDAAVSGI